MVHQAVLLNEAIDALVTDPSGIYLDGTFGRGGHSKAILDRLTEDGKLIAIDKDLRAVEHGKETFHDPRFALIHGSFADMDTIVQQQDCVGQLSGILLDLGVSSPQIDTAERGFSYAKDGPLDMRMDQSSGQTAAQWLATADEADIARVLWEYGEERFSRRIAKAIVTAREEQPITTTFELVDLISKAQPRRDPNKHPATRSFQAIRIFINRELDDLQRCLDGCISLLKKGGRLAIISFHSLEDRMVKRFMKNLAKGDAYPKDLPIVHEKIQVTFKTVGRAIRPTNEESQQNPRARSAVLRIGEKI